MLLGQVAGQVKPSLSCRAQAHVAGFVCRSGQAGDLSEERPAQLVALEAAVRPRARI